jgi:hypothetical protein
MAAISDFAGSIRSKRAQAAVDDEIGAGNIAALVESQEQRRGSNLLGATKAVERSGGPKPDRIASAPSALPPGFVRIGSSTSRSMLCLQHRSFLPSR